MSPEPILIVDDNPANLKLARVLLHSAGYEVREATDAEQALKLLEGFRPRLILMDIQLPGMDGLTLTRLLKDDPATKDIIVLALTAYAMKGDEARARAAGCDGYVAKPIDTEALLRVVGEHMARVGEHEVAPQRPEILVVEDNAATLRVFQLALRAEGYTVVEAMDAAAAIRSVQQRPPALALIDLLLPDVPGSDLARRIRTLPGGAEIPLIAVSGFPGLAGDPNGGIGEFDAVIAKPIEPHRLVEIVRAYLPSGSAAPPVGEVGDKHVLVVDDDAVQLKLTAVRLRHAGFDVITAQRAEDGLTLARARPPDLIVSDVLMPEIDGFALCLRVRADPKLAHVPVVLASAYYCEREDEDLARRVGANALVVRSPDMGELVRVVQSRLGTEAPQGGHESPVVIEQAHQQRVVQKLERQAIANAGMARRCALQAAQLSILGGIADALTKSHDLPLAVGEILASCLDAGSISKGALYRVDHEGKLVLQNTIGFTDADRSAIAIAFECARVLDDAIASGRPISISEGDANAFLPRLGVASALIVPLVGNGERVGALLLGSSFADLNAPELLAFARSIAAYVGQAIALGLAFERVQAARREAERASRAKDEFLSTLSHELRTPLTAILGWATMARTKPRDLAVLERAMIIVERNAKAQARLIDDMLDVARIDAGKIRIDARALSVIPLIQASLEAVAPAAEAKGVRIEADLDPTAGLLWGDPSRVQQIVWNLVMNGVKFTPSGGVVRTRLVERDGKIEIGVSDTGIGIATDFLPYVFDRFRQADSSNTRAHGGLGLGLTIVRQLVELHGGEIRAESAGQGRGATFTVTFPVVAPLGDAPAPVPPPPDRRAAPRAPRLDGVRVLAVEDEPDTREMLAVVLHAAGAVVAAAASAAEALGAIARETPDVLVSDISMPDMSGYDLVRAIRRLPAPDGIIPAVAITAYASLDDRRNALEAGFEEHLAKPVDPDILIAVVARLRHDAAHPAAARATRGA